ncbi:MAG: TIGR04282 family arsenosugar biosynthesis glycosyltransferase [Pseudomonadota bacterium]|nr:TIGR04282 family arsenosugar biosynthesis glycosyltransferase [Pseudomonadota bacterium]
MEIERSIIQVFSKNLVPGAVKTRLMPVLRGNGAYELQKIMLERLLNEVTKLNNPAEIWTDSVVAHPLIIESGFPHKIQRGKDLGERMLHAIENGLRKAKKVILVGSDLPPLDRFYIDEANKALDAYDVVFGPTEDGGFGLIATKIVFSDMFNLVNWSSDSVLSDILRNLAGRSVGFHCLPFIWDVDTPNDLERCFEFMNMQISDLGIDI